MLENLDQFAMVPTGPNTCKVRTIREELSDADRDKLDAAIADVRGFSTNSLYRALNALGVKIGYNSLMRHRKNLCSCGRFNA